jgi:hypothetical protein
MVKAYIKKEKVTINDEVVYDRKDGIVLSENDDLADSNVHIDFKWEDIDEFCTVYPMYAVCQQKKKCKVLKLYNPILMEIVSYRDDESQLKIRHEIYYEKYQPSINEILDIKDELAIKYLSERFKKFLETT